MDGLSWRIYRRMWAIGDETYTRSASIYNYNHNLSTSKYLDSLYTNFISHSSSLQDQPMEKPDIFTFLESVLLTYIELLKHLQAA